MVWTGKREFARLSAFLATAEGRDFERKALIFLRTIWPEARGTPRLRAFDRAGADHLVWSDTPPFPLVVQCKGFQVLDDELQASQIRQCRRSIRSFAASGLDADVYLLVHNRTGENEDFRLAVAGELEGLVGTGRVQRAELWDRKRLLTESFDAMLTRVRRGIGDRTLSGARPAPVEILDFAPLEEVPLQLSTLVADQNKLRSRTTAPAAVADPADMILDEAWEGLSLLVGEFGFGKTTAVARALARSEEHVLFVHGASISKTTVGAKDLLVQCIDTDFVLAEFPDGDREVLHRVLRPTVEYLLKERDLDLVLVLDGIDESAFLGHGGAIQKLFNMLESVGPRVVLTMRSEFWASRYGEFESVIGDVASHGEPRNKKIRLVELLPWRLEEIRELIARELCRYDDPAGQENLTQLQDLARSPQFESLYGDIPKRPLFLRFILDSVARDGLPGRAIGRAELFRDWARAKISRDVRMPVRVGGTGRLPIGREGESLETTVELAWEAMLAAASSMVELESERVEIVPEVRLDVALADAAQLRELEEPAGLFLNSLLLPVGARTGTSKVRIRFAHRAFQEYFLAWATLVRRQDFSGLDLPSGVERWREALITEEIPVE